MHRCPIAPGHRQLNRVQMSQLLCLRVYPVLRQRGNSKVRYVSESIRIRSSAVGPNVNGSLNPKEAPDSYS